MKRVILAALAATALSSPAVAQAFKAQGLVKTVQALQNSNQRADKTPTKHSNSQSEHNKGERSATNNQALTVKLIDSKQAVQFINPMQLTKSQIRQVQRALGKKGFSVREIDGVWGPETAAALRLFQQHINIGGGGHLTRKTLAIFGVNWASSD